MSDQNDIIYDSPASAPDDAFWLEQGRKMVTRARYPGCGRQPHR